MTSSETFVIVGASLAGAKAAEALRQRGFDGRLIMVGEEGQRPYERPPLSKGYLADTSALEEAFVHAANWYADNDVDLRLGLSATGIDRGGRTVRLGDGTSLSYDKLLLTTGARARRVSVPGADAGAVHYLRTLDDCESLRSTLKTISRLVVIGAGWIGLEVAATARQAGVAVAVVESANLPLLRVLGPEVASVFADLHREHGVDFRFNSSLAEIRVVGGRATGVTLADSTVIEADAVLVAVGAEPNTELAVTAGLEVDNGIVVDASLRTNDLDIFAAGDVAKAFHPFYERHIRVEHWANALNQPAVAAASMLGREASYTELPFFYTDQYDLGMEYFGYVDPTGYDEVVFRGDVAGREFIAFWLKDGRVVAGMNVNVWDVGEQLKALIRSRAKIGPSKLTDTSVDLSWTESL